MSKVGLFLVVTFVWSWGQWWPAVMFASGAWTAPEGLPPSFVTGGLAA